LESIGCRRINGTLSILGISFSIFIVGIWLFSEKIAPKILYKLPLKEFLKSIIGKLYPVSSTILLKKLTFKVNFFS
jgi:hypothetical protein